LFMLPLALLGLASVARRLDVVEHGASFVCPGVSFAIPCFPWPEHWNRPADGDLDWYQSREACSEFVSDAHTGQWHVGTYAGLQQRCDPAGHAHRLCCTKHIPYSPDSPPPPRPPPQPDSTLIASIEHFPCDSVSYGTAFVTPCLEWPDHWAPERDMSVASAYCLEDYGADYAGMQQLCMDEYTHTTLKRRLCCVQIAPPPPSQPPSPPSMYERYLAQVRNEDSGEVSTAAVLGTIVGAFAVVGLIVVAAVWGIRFEARRHHAESATDLVNDTELDQAPRDFEAAEQQAGGLQKLGKYSGSPQPAPAPGPSA